MGRKGQTAIEYMTTYAWMAVAVALVGGTMYTQMNFGCDLNARGFSSPFPVVDDLYQYENETVVMDVRNPSDDDINLDYIRVADENNTVADIYADENIRGEASKAISTNRFKYTEECNTWDVNLDYIQGNLDNLTSEGEITGNLEIVPLVADFFFSPQFADTNETINFDAGPSSSENTITNYTWNFGDGNTSKGETATHSYPRSGVYEVELTVKDNEGITDKVTKQLFIGNILPETHAISRIGIQNTLATNCIGSDCDNKSTEDKLVIYTEGDTVEETMFTEDVIKQGDVCLTDRTSFDTDQGCNEYIFDQSGLGLLSEQNWNMTGSLELPSVMPENSSICIGSTSKCENP